MRRSGISARTLVRGILVCMWSTTAPVSAAMHVGTNFWFRTDWSGERPFKANVNFATETNPWNPVFLDEIRIYSTLRFMDWMTTNWSGLSRWNQRTLKTDPIQEGRTNGASQRQPDGRETWGVAYEWLIDLCNRNRSHLWVCIPHLVFSTADQTTLTNDYAIKLAVLIRHGIDMRNVNVLSMGDISGMTAEQLIAAGGVRTCEPLAPGLHVYVEYSNETWNGMFSQCDYCIRQGGVLGLPGNQWYQGWGFQTFGAVRAWESFGRVFGMNSTRFKRVIAGQVGWGGGDQCKTMVEALANPKVNPRNLRCDYWGGAPYMSGESVAALRSSINNCITMVMNNKQWLTSRGIGYISYEGGQHAIQAADVVSRDPAIYDCYMQYLRAMNGVTDDVFCHYAHCGNWGARGAWGAKAYTGQPLAEAHKYRALYDWVAANPNPPVPVLRSAHGAQAGGVSHEQVVRIVGFDRPGSVGLPGDARRLDGRMGTGLAIAPGVRLLIPEAR